MRNKIEGRFFSNHFWKLGGNRYALAGRRSSQRRCCLPRPSSRNSARRRDNRRARTAVQLPLSGRTAQTNGSVKTSEAPAPSTTATVNTLNPNVQVQGVYAGSTPGVANMPFNGKLGLREAIQRGLAYNLGQTGATQALRQAEGQKQSGAQQSAAEYQRHGQRKRSNHRSAARLVSDSIFRGSRFHTVIGPFNYIDFRAHLSQSVFDFTAINNYRAASDVAKANRYSAQDARELIVLAVGGAYLQTIAAKRAYGFRRSATAERQCRLRPEQAAARPGTHRQSGRRPERSAGADAPATPALPQKRSGQAKNKSRAHDRPAAERSIRHYRRSALRARGPVDHRRRARASLPAARRFESPPTRRCAPPSAPTPPRAPSVTLRSESPPITAASASTPTSCKPPTRPRPA